MKANGIKIRIIPVIPEKFLGFDFPEKTNCIVIWKGGLAVVVDPGGEAEKIARFLRRNKLEVDAYWLTHAHPDHVGGLSALLDEFPAPVRYHRADSLWISSTLPIASIRKSEWFRPFCSIRRIACGGISAKVILTPGHTRGGVCYWFDQLGVLLTGDTIVRGGVGETGWLFPGSNSDELEASRVRISRAVPHKTKILPGHGCATTVGRESVEIKYKRKSSMSKIHTSFKEVERAYVKVRGELIARELLWDGSKLDEVECYHEALNPVGLIGWMGFYEFIQEHGDGNIHFPAVYNGLDLHFRWTDKMTAVDVLRHEFGHALSDRYPAALRKGGVFRTAFGGPCGNSPAPGIDPQEWEECCVSGYAPTNTREDFAETFRLFLKHKGKIPAKYAKKPVIRKKWKAVAEIVKRVAAAKK